MSTLLQRLSETISCTPLSELRKPSGLRQQQARLVRIDAVAVELAGEWPDAPIECVIAAAEHRDAFVHGTGTITPIGLLGSKP